MFKRKIAMAVLSVAVLILELLPYGAVCVFMDDGGTKIRRTYSYFSLIPYGYADFSPLITAVLSCVILVLCLILCFRKSQKLNKTLATVSGSAAVISLLPLVFFGFRFFSLCAAAISTLLVIIFILALSVKKRKNF